MRQAHLFHEAAEVPDAADAGQEAPRIAFYGQNPVAPPAEGELLAQLVTHGLLEQHDFGRGRMWRVRR